MEQERPQRFEYEIKDVAEWNQQTELAYWKSRAMALEYENKILMECIKDSCVKNINKQGESINAN